MTNRRITIELELSEDAMDAYAHLEAIDFVPSLPGVSVCGVIDSHPPETLIMCRKQAD